MSLYPHELKCWLSGWQEVAAGRKSYEVRTNDRDYQIGDLLRLWCWYPDRSQTDGRVITVVVTAMSQGRWGLPSDICVLGFDPNAARATVTRNCGDATNLFGQAGVWLR